MKLAKLWKIIFLTVIIAFLALTAYLFISQKQAQAQAQAVHLTACGTLSQANTTYILDNDVSSTGTCFTIAASGITLDLNGHTVTYDNFANTGLPNPGFELGSGDVPDNWDLSRAPSAKRRPTSELPLPEKWYLEFENPADGEEIVSGWTYLPANSRVMVYFLRGDAVWAYTNPPILNLTVEFEDGSTVFSQDFSAQSLFQFQTKPSVGKYRVHFMIKDYISPPGQYGRNISIDLLDLRPTDYYGVNVEYKSGTTIKNGKIVQGQAKSSMSHNIRSYASGITVDNMYLEASGMEAGGVWTDYSGGRVVNSTIVSGSLYQLTSRSRLYAPIKFENAGPGSIISGNRITSGSGWGCIQMNTENGVISNNYCFTKTVITNHHGILFDGKNTKVFNNTIVADPGQGILTGGKTDVEIFNNTIFLKSQAPNVEYGNLSLDAIRLNDYGSGLCKNAKVHDNKIYITGDYDNYYGPGGQIVYGIANICTGENAQYYNNYIKVDVVEGDAVGYGLEMGGLLGNSLIWKDNVIESNHKNIVFGGYSGDSINARFVSNTLIKGANPRPDYATFHVVRSPEVRNTHLVDTKLVNGATMENVTNLYAAKYNYYVDWYLNVLVKDNNGTPIESAAVEIKDVNGAIVFSGATDANGRVDNITLNQYRNYGERWGQPPRGTENSTPHSISISKSGYPTETKTLTMDSSKEMAVILDGQTTEPPIISAVAASVDQTAKTATITWQTDRAADSKVEYGIDTSYGQNKTDATLTTTHSLQITNLSPNTYHFRVTSKDAQGRENQGVDHTFFLLGVRPYLTLSKSVDKTSAVSGDTLTYTITYTNGTEQSNNVKLEDPLPTGTSYINGSATGGGSFDGTKVTWNLASLAPGASGSVQFKVEIKEGS